MRGAVAAPVAIGLLAVAGPAGWNCTSGQIALSAKICEIAVRDVRKSRELRRVKERATIDRVTAILRAPRSRKSSAVAGGTLPAGRFNLLLYACGGPVDQLAIGINFISDYQAKRVYELSVTERNELRRLLGLHF